MFFWFAGVSVLAIFMVFQSPALDYRLVVLGALLPLVEIPIGHAFVLHTLVFSVVLMGAVMLVTRHRRLARRRWIGLPIGVLVHLVLDGVWMQTPVFFWPFFGLGFGTDAVPEVGHGFAIALVLEALGLAASAWCWSLFDFRDPHNRRTFLRTGHLPRELASP